MSNLINWHELSRKLSGSGQNIRPNKIPKKYERRVKRLLYILAVWDRWCNCKCPLTGKLDLTNVPIGKTMRLFKKNGKIFFEETINLDNSKCP